MDTCSPLIQYDSSMTSRNTGRESTFADEHLVVPARVQIKRGRLYWTAQDTKKKGAVRRNGQLLKPYIVLANPVLRLPPDDLHLRFARLQKANDSAIADFAAAWGVLGI